MNKRMTLVEKLEKELAKNCRLNNWDLGFKAAIDIVKGYNEWINVDDCLPDERVKVLARSNMKTYTIKQPIFELHEADGWQGKRWYANNVEHYFYIYYDADNPLPYLIRYSFNDYMDEDGERFKNLDEAKECLIVEFNEYVARNLDEVK